MSRLDRIDVNALSPEAVEWLINGERGLSSECIFEFLCLGRVDKWRSYPLDPDDFRRCELLLRQVPDLRKKFPLMAALCHEWRALVSHWDAIAALIEEEVPGAFEYPGRCWGHAPRAYALMAGIEQEARAAA